MNCIANKNIILGITGGIAAYKTPELVRGLKKQGANVRVVMTQSAKEFVAPLALQAVSNNPVSYDLFDPASEAAMSHIELARWADLILIAPATANTIAHLNEGKAKDLLTTLALAAHAQIAIAPAMNQQMWLNQQTQNNITRLSKKGFTIFGPASGEQACGEFGPGRMLEPDELVEMANTLFEKKALTGKNFLITAGPTQEAIDPVRYLSNHSSGKMGFALAQAAMEAGANVTLIAGPVHLATPEHVTRIDVSSALEMQQAVCSLIKEQDVFISAAAVADYRIEQIAETKIKKTNEKLELSLIKNPDILKTVSEENKNLFTVGFAAETDKLLQHAKVKLVEKNLNMIVANDVSKIDRGFNSENNACVVLTKSGQQEYPLMPKKKLAGVLIEVIAEHYLSCLKVAHKQEN